MALRNATSAPITEPDASHSGAASRATALDALRGLAILLMVLAGVIPWDDRLPAWMYHAQEPPPSHEFNPLRAGLTWVDLVFPLFLFAMGAAIPLACARRLEKGATRRQIVVSTLQRGGLLAWFAIYFQHIRPYTLAPHPTALTWFIAMFGFGLLFPMFARWPENWPAALQPWVRGIGWTGAIVLLVALRYPAGSDLTTHFSVYRSDIILIVLANMAVFGSLLWLTTRHNPLLRVGVLGLYLALRLSSASSGWVQTLWNISPLPWLFQWDYLKYLGMVVPGTLAGDALLASSRAHREPTLAAASAERWRQTLLALTGVAITLIVLAGLESRHVLSATVGALTGCGIALWLVAPFARPPESLLRICVRQGAYWLLLGLVLEPYEGGIKKDHATLSYLFVTSGLAFLLLVSLTVVTNQASKSRWVGLLADVGQNPMIGYVAMGNLIQPLLALTGLDTRLGGWFDERNAWLGVVRGLAETLLLACVVRFFTRRRLYWRT